MSKVLKHNGYIGSIDYSIEDEILYGKIECINDVITYEADNIKDLKAEFINAVDDYIDTCKQLGIEPNKPMNGSFNVRIGEDLHKKVFYKSKELGVTLNEFVRISLQEKISNKREIHFHFEQEERKPHSLFGSFSKRDIEKKWINEEAVH